MTHEAGIEAAATIAYDWSGSAFYPDFEMETSEYVSRIIQAYLSESGTVLVPREPDEDVLDKMNTGFWFDQDDARQVWVGLVNAAKDQFKSKP